MVVENHTATSASNHSQKSTLNAPPSKEKCRSRASKPKAVTYADLKRFWSKTMDGIERLHGYFHELAPMVRPEVRALCLVGADRADDLHNEADLFREDWLPGARPRGPDQIDDCQVLMEPVRTELGVYFSLMLISVKGPAARDICRKGAELACEINAEIDRTCDLLWDMVEAGGGKALGFDLQYETWRCWRNL